MSQYNENTITADTLSDLMKMKLYIQRIEERLTTEHTDRDLNPNLHDYTNYGDAQDMDDMLNKFKELSIRVADNVNSIHSHVTYKDIHWINEVNRLWCIHERKMDSSHMDDDSSDLDYIFHDTSEHEIHATMLETQPTSSNVEYNNPGLTVPSPQVYNTIPTLSNHNPLILSPSLQDYNGSNQQSYSPEPSFPSLSLHNIFSSSIGWSRSNVILSIYGTKLTFPGRRFYTPDHN